MSLHHCHANQCATPTEQKFLMCPKHWHMVPKDMQLLVWKTFKARGNYPGESPEKWADYYDACADAVEHVAAIEGKKIHNAYRGGGIRFRERALQRIQS